MIDVISGLFLSLLGAGYYLNAEAIKKGQHPPGTNGNGGVEDAGTGTGGAGAEGTGLLGAGGCTQAGGGDDGTDMISGKEANIRVPDSFDVQLLGVLDPQYYNTKGTQTDIKVDNANYQPNLIFQNFSPEVQERIKSRLNLADLKKKQRDFYRVKETVDGVLDNTSGMPIAHREEVDRECDLTHNNMVPFFGSRVTQNTDIDNRMASHKLELYTGQYKNRQQNKKETKKLFPPIANLTNVYGATNFNRDLSRFNPNNTGKRSNELPFEQIRVGRGLGQGFTARPSGGFHDQIRLMPKRNEELFVNPKTESSGRIVYGKSLVPERTTIGSVYKYKPTLLVDNQHGQRNFTTVGGIRAPKYRSGIILKNTDRSLLNRPLNKGPAGPADFSYHTPEGLIAKGKLSNKQNFLNTPYRNVIQTTGKRMNDFSRTGYQNKPNERMKSGPRNGDGQNLRSLTNWVKKITNYLFDRPRYTRKQEYVNHPRPYGNFNTNQPGKQQAYDPCAWAARTTIREGTENNKYQGGVAASGQTRSQTYDPAGWAARTTIREGTENTDHLGHIRRAGERTPAYDPAAWAARTTIREGTENTDHMGHVRRAGERTPAYDPAGWAARTTIREGTENTDHMGSLKTPQRKTPAYDPAAWAARTTIREGTEDQDHMGSLKTPQRKSPVYDPTGWAAKTTHRETTEDQDHMGNVKPLERKTPVYDPCYNARTTHRETTEDNQHQGGVAARSQVKSQVYDPTGWAARTTHRETTEDNDHVGNIDRGTIQDASAYQTTNWEVKNTQRQFTSDYEYTGIAKANHEKTRSYDNAYNAELNVNKECIARGRKPTQTNVKLGKGKGYYNIEVKKMDTDRVDRRGKVKDSSIGNRFNPKAVTQCTQTSFKNIPQEDYHRLDPTLLEPFRKNGFTQSLHSY